MSRDMNLLDPLLREKVKGVIQETADGGYVAVPFFTQRSPFEQARIYRSTRGSVQIESKVQKLIDAGAPFLAYCLTSVGPQYPPPGITGNLTNALPGYSWHNWGFACDCFIKTARGKAIWSAGHIGYKIYAEAAVRAGLTSGYYWKNPVDAPHIQLYNFGVRKRHTAEQINDRMKQIYG